MSLNLDQFNSANMPPTQPTKVSRGPLYFFIGTISVLLVVVIVVLYIMLIGQGRNLAQGKHESKSSAQMHDSKDKAKDAKGKDTDKDDDKPNPADSPLDGEQLSYAVEHSTCDDATADAIPFFDLVVAAQSADQWNSKTKRIVSDNLSALNLHCRRNISHLLAVQRAFVDPQAPPQLNALVKDAQWITRISPAPANAQTPSGRFTTELDNIHCSMDVDGTSCTIREYNWPVPSDCQGKPATVRIDTNSATPKFTCDAPVTAEMQYDYGTALDNHGYACTVENSGINCWSEFTGHGFAINRQELKTY